MATKKVTELETVKTAAAATPATTSVTTAMDKFLFSDHVGIKGVREDLLKMSKADFLLMSDKDFLILRRAFAEIFPTWLSEFCAVSGKSVDNPADIADIVTHKLRRAHFLKLGFKTESEYKASLSVPTAPKSKTSSSVIDYSPLISELQLLHDNAAYTETQAADIKVIIDGLTITDTNSAMQAKTFYTDLTTDEDLADLQAYISTALKAYSERKAEEAKAAEAKELADESERKAAIRARFKRS